MNSSLSAAWVNPEGTMLSEISHTEEDKYCNDLIYKLHKERQAHRYREHLVEGERDWCRLPVIT